jgi:probable phosphoglycerate mutase
VGGGLFGKRVAERHPIAQELFEQQRWDVIPGAEQADRFAQRVQVTSKRLVADHADQRIALFTHAGFIGQALALASGSRPFSCIRCDNISRSVWVVRRFNDTAHLAPAFSSLPCLRFES